MLRVRKCFVAHASCVATVTQGVKQISRSNDWPRTILRICLHANTEEISHLVAFSTKRPRQVMERGAMTKTSTLSSDRTVKLAAPNGAFQSVTTTWTRCPAATSAPILCGSISCLLHGLSQLRQ